MGKPIIGVIAPRFEDKERAFQNYTRIVDNFPKRVLEAGGIPIGICFPGGKFNTDVLDLCDGFLFQGGPSTEAARILAVDYAIKHKKPILGICLGMQTMAGYEWAFKNMGLDNIEKNYTVASEIYFMEDKEGHNKLDPFYNKDIEKSYHEIFLDKDSLLAQIFHTDVLNMPSIHNSVVKDEIFEDGQFFKVTGRDKNGIIEVIESLNPDHWMIGVQFHPELEEQNKILFEKFIQQAKR